MLERYGEACAFTGPQPPGALEAAHLYLYSTNPEHDLRGGLLLRSDLHALFDRYLITIDPDTWSIQIGPDLKRYPDLAELDGQPVRLPQEIRPRHKYVEDHALTARATWKQELPDTNCHSPWWLKLWSAEISVGRRHQPISR